MRPHPLMWLSLAVTALFGTSFLASADQALRPMTGLELQRQVAAEVNCASQLAKIMRAAQAWSFDNGDQPPPGFHVLTNEFQPTDLFCPAFFHEAIPTTWAEIDWEKTDYIWSKGVDWNNPSATAVTCRAHQAFAQVDGVVRGKGYRAGWPLLVASPIDVSSTPGDHVTFEFQLAPDTLTPLCFQWRRSCMELVTNAVGAPDPENPNILKWTTNVAPVFVGTNLPGQTNATLRITTVTTDDSGFYSVAISSELGVALSRHAILDVSGAHAGIHTNATWSGYICGSKLRELWIFAAIWARAHNSFLPQSLAEMTNQWGQPIFGWPLALYCPADTDRVPAESWNQVDFSDTSYELLLPAWLNDFDVLFHCRAHGYYISLDGTLMVGPVLSGISRVDAGTVVVSFRPFAGKTNFLEASSDLSTWTTVGTYGPEPADIRLRDSISEKQRFYRARME